VEEKKTREAKGRENTLIGEKEEKLCCGSGQFFRIRIRKLLERHKKVKWKGKFNKEHLLCGVLLDLLTRKIK
jgi:hypothetical protein